MEVSRPGPGFLVGHCMIPFLKRELNIGDYFRMMDIKFILGMLILRPPFTLPNEITW